MALATFATTGAAVADEQPQPTQAVAQKVSATATVEKVDAKKRELTLTDAKGNRFMLQVPEDVARFDAIKKGDKLDVDYYESLALSLQPHDKAAAPPSAQETATAERYPGKLPGGVMGRKITATATVLKVDPADNKITLKGPDGAIDTVNVRDPAMQSQLARIKKGDRIEASYSEAIALSVAPKNKE
jgi:Cu/Ag efflux protein CusF